LPKVFFHKFIKQVNITVYPDNWSKMPGLHPRSSL
jgi:hypothetical protein